MKPHTEIKKKIQRVINNAEMDRQNCLLLIEISKLVDYGDINYSNSINSEITFLYYEFIEDISVWLRIPKNVVLNKIKDQSFNELENKFIITNILMKAGRTKKGENDEDTFEF